MTDLTIKELLLMHKNLEENIKEGFQRIEDKLTDHTKVHEAILTQTTNTNGKVAEIQRWRERLMGGAAVAAFFFTFVILPIVVWAVLTVRDIDTTVRTEIETAFDNYDFNITQYEETK